MKIVVDTNILFSFFKRDSTTRRIITSVEFFEFYTLKSRFDELLKHKEEICVKANITNEDFLKTIHEIRLFVEVVEDEEVKEYSVAAREIAPHEEDIPCFALALALNSPVWSNEKEFKSQSKIKVFSTSDIVNLLFKPV